VIHYGFYKLIKLYNNKMNVIVHNYVCSILFTYNFKKNCNYHIYGAINIKISGILHDCVCNIEFVYN